MSSSDRPLTPIPTTAFPEEHQPSLVSAAVLVKRARRPARGLTEEWIRQHTASDIGSEARHWLSDGTGDSEDSSLSGSISRGEEAAWLDEDDLRTPRASQGSFENAGLRRPSRQHPRARSSVETLRESDIRRLNRGNAKMSSPEAEKVTPDGASENSSNAVSSLESALLAAAPASSPPPAKEPAPRNAANGSATGGATKTVGFNLPGTPPRSPSKKELPVTPRLKKKVPWKGKNIMVLLPRDDERGKPGKAPMPLSEGDVNGMLRSWEQLGYDISGFDLNGSAGYTDLSSYSMSRGAWPDFDDLAKERAERKYNILLPDLNAWKRYVEELNEAKLRALGVSLAEDEPPAPSISPAVSQLSRQPSISHYPALPFSPPVPASSASSGQAFPFPPPFIPVSAAAVSSAAQSPGIPAGVSPVSFNGKFNPRQSISIPAGAFQMPQQQPTPLGFSPLVPHGLPRGGSPSLANFAALMSPTSPFSPDSFPAPLHQRHQSLQYPLLNQPQFQTSARASPRLQDLREVIEEETQTKSPSKTPEPGPFVRHNASASLQKEIDDAEYHLEEQLRSQLEHDKDYSPHDEREIAEMAGDAGVDESLHARGPSVQFAPQIERFRDDAENGLVLHQPRPHSRGHSLANNYYVDQEEVRDSTDEGSFERAKQPQRIDTQKQADEAYEIETNPSNLGTPIQALDLGNILQNHPRSFSTASNPWSDVPSFSSKQGHTRPPSHGSKASMSKFNVEAPEFKFNPTSTFSPSQFVFGNNAAFAPSIFQAGLGPNAPLSANSSQFSLPTTNSSKVNAGAPVFSPGQSEFSFSAAGPKMRPDAPAFTPFHSISNSITSAPQSGSESAGKKGSSIFGKIDLSISDVVKPAKTSKAIPIVRPSSKQSMQASENEQQQYDQEGRITDETRVKRAKASAADGDEVPLFAKPSGAPLPLPGQTEPAEAEAPETVEETTPGEPKPLDEENILPEDTMLSSTIVSESTDTKAATATSPSETSPQQSTMNWASCDFKPQLGSAGLDAAKPNPLDAFQRHKKSLSATAKPFVPGMLFGTSPAAESADEPTADELAEPIESVELDEEDITRESIEEPAPMEPSPISPAAPSLPHGLLTSRFASPPPAPRGLAASRYASSPSPPPAPQPKTFGLGASRYAVSPPSVSAEEDRQTPEPGERELLEHAVSPPDDRDNTQGSLAQPETPLDLSPGGGEHLPEDDDEEREPTFEEIDEIMRHLNENDPAKGVNKKLEAASAQRHQPSPTRPTSLVGVTESSPLRLPPQAQIRAEAQSPSPRRYHLLPRETHKPMLSTELEDPFIDPPHSAVHSYDGPVHRLNGSESVPVSDWDGTFTDEEQLKLESRVNYFDGHVNDVVGNLLASRLVPVEKTLETIQNALVALSGKAPSGRSERRSMSAEMQESDADDEDEEMPVTRRSMSPRRDKRMEQIRTVLLDALATHQRNLLPPPAPAPAADEHMESILRTIEEMKEQLGQAPQVDFRSEDLRSIVEEALERRMPPPAPEPVAAEGQEELSNKYNELQVRMAELEQRLRVEQNKVETEISSRRAAEERAADIHRKLEMAETKIEVEIMNRRAYDQRVADLEDRLKHQEDKTEEELNVRRAAEDRLSEVQRLLRISSEEETRLREVLDERDQKIKSIEDSRAKSAMRLALLEAAQNNTQKTQSDLLNRLNAMEVDLRDKTQEARHWRSEAERTIDLSQRQGDDLAQTTNENKHLKKVIDTLGTQMEENERVREAWRAKFIALQEEMSRAAREIAEESARRIKKEQTLLARQEVLDARLQAEAKTRERLESELERLENGERQGLRAVSECKRLEVLLGELRTENHKLQQTAARYQTEFQEARESGAREVQRTRDSMQSEIENANHQVNAAREQFEDRLSSVRAQHDQLKLDAETAKARYEMLLEEVQNSHRGQVEALAIKHQNEVEDLQARYERKINNVTEDAQRAERDLLERLSISTSKTEHLQDRITLLEEKLEIAKEAAAAAAKAAKSPAPILSPAPVPSPVQAVLQPAPSVQAKAAAPVGGTDLPEKISPQALRESIMVLQEQLQEREQRIEELEQSLSKVDPEAENKIAKRDDEISWLRELLAVRHSDLQDIIVALDSDNYDVNTVRDAAIRLKANLQMEEQERERAMNGGSAISLPNIAASIRNAATPRVAQAVGPLAAAWGNWRKSRDPVAYGSSPAGAATSTPSKEGPSPSSSSSFLSGMLTPPASGMRQTPPSRHGPARRTSGQQQQQHQQQPTAFSSTGRRFTGEGMSRSVSNRPRELSSASLKQLPSTATAADKMPARGTPPRRQSRGQPVTPPMMRPSAYDSDAHAEDFDDAAFFDD